MKVYYSDVGRDVFKALYDVEAYMWIDKIAAPHSMLEIDEVDPDNKALCADIYAYQGYVDNDGQSKYYVDGGELYERDGWEKMSDA